jgi:hypothetical protein
MLMAVTTLVVGALCFFVGRRSGIRAAEKQFNALGGRWFVRPHTEETLLEFGLADGDTDDAPFIASADYVRSNAAGSNSRMS